MATLIENAAAVKSASGAIDAAIIAKGGTTAGGLANAAAAISALPSGGGDISQLTVTANGTYTAAEGAGYSPVVVDVPSSLDSNIDKIISGVGYIGDIVNNSITTLRAYALGGSVNSNQLHGFYSTSVQTIGESAFAKQLSLKVVDCPNCMSIAANAISYVAGAESIRLGSPLDVYANAFNNCTIANLSFGVVNFKAQAAFSGSKAREVSLTVGNTGLIGYDFRNSTTVIYNLRGVTAISTACFSGCNSVTTVNLPDALAADIFASSSGTSFGSLRIQAVIVCKDADIRNVGGAWTIVER